jgi:hypothetical protein
MLIVQFTYLPAYLPTYLPLGATALGEPWPPLQRNIKMHSVRRNTFLLLTNSLEVCLYFVSL